MPHIAVVVSEADRASLASALSDVTALVDASEAALETTINSPVAGSELANCARKDPDGWWFMYAQSSLNVCTDHLRALLTSWTARAGLPHSAGYTLIRGATEAAARACWLVDSSLPSRSRVARGIVERSYTIDRFERLEGNTLHIQRRRQVLEATVSSAGYSLGGSGSKANCEGQVRPGITALMRSLLGASTISGGGTQGELAYSLLSGYAHAEAWTILMDQKPAPGGQGVMVELNVPRHILLLRVAALRLLHTSICCLLELAGFDVNNWKKVALPLVLGSGGAAAPTAPAQP